MSFLSSHRLHWGVHHELTDNFWLQIERMVQPHAGEPSPLAPDSDHHPASSPLSGESPSSLPESRTEALGP